MREYRKQRQRLDVEMVALSARRLLKAVDELIDSDLISYGADRETGLGMYAAELREALQGRMVNLDRAVFYEGD